jgi:hypothetical protein
MWNVVDRFVKGLAQNTRMWVVSMIEIDFVNNVHTIAPHLKLGEVTKFLEVPFFNTIW